MVKYFLQLFLTTIVALSWIQPSSSLRPDTLTRHMLGMDKPFTSTHLLSEQNISAECKTGLDQMWNSNNTMKILDAFGKPDAGFLVGNWNWLGHYQECMNITEYNYCLSFLLLNLGNASITMMPGAAIRWGLCLPQVCSDSDVLNSLINIFDMVELPFNLSDVNATRVDCVKDPPIPFSPGFIVFVTISSILAFLMLTGTILDVILICISKRRTPYLILDNTQVNVAGNVKVHENLSTNVSRQGSGTADSDGQADKLSQHRTEDDSATLVTKKETCDKANQLKEPKGLFPRFLLSFAVSRNMTKLVVPKISHSSIACLNGIRVLSISWVILGHTFMSLSLQGISQNLAHGFTWLSGFGFQAVSNAFPSVDTFFFLSGLLVAYTTLGRMAKTQGTIPWHWFYFHRYWRLTPALGMAILIQLYLRPFLGEGPIWQGTAEDPNCEQYWWTDLLYINNFYPTNANTCIDWVWYLANDTQFFLISPIIIIALYWRPVLGVIITLSLCVVSAIVTVVLMVHYEFSATLMSQFFTGAGGPSYFDIVYSKPYCRIQPYLIGILLGYALHRRGTHYKLTFHPAVVAAGWSIASGIGVAVVYGLYGTYHGHDLSTAESAIYMALSRFAWACCLVWVVVACKYGYGGWVNDFLSWSAWVPLSRLTYSTYLLHLILIAVFVGNMASPIYLSIMLFSVYFVGIMAISFGAAAVLALAVEYPFASIEKLFLPRI